MVPNYLRLILICAVAPPASAQVPEKSPSPATISAAGRIATTARLAAEEYGLGVRDGKMVLPAEVEEARLFLTEARRIATGMSPADAARVGPRVDTLLVLVERLASPDSLRSVTEAMVLFMTRELGVTFDELPAEAPSYTRGAAIFRSSCASCHGLLGKGDGGAGVGLTPPPSNLADATALRAASPLDFYRRISIGIAGTAMPSYESRLSSADRWAVALYASMLRLPSAAGAVPASLRGFQVTAGMSDQVLIDSLGAADLAWVAAVRAATGPSPADYGAIFTTVRQRLDSATELARLGRTDEARSSAIAAYMSFEAVERQLRIKDAKLVTRLEAAFAEMRDRTREPKRLAAAREELARALDRAEGAVGERSSPVSLFAESAVILLREGLEAILVVGALIAVLAKLGASDRRREIHLGVAVAILLSGATAVLIETVFRMSPAYQEALEGATMVVATVMLFGVSYWLVSKMEVAKWNQFVRSQLSAALDRRSMFALSSVAFLAVYREGFETVLFYKALAVSAGEGVVAGPIGLGIVAASVALAIIYVAINRFGVRLPLKPFFGATSGFLYLMAVVFAGKAVAELQEGGMLSSTPVEWMGRVPSVGIYPTAETVAAQGILVALGIFALIWIFVVTPRRAPVNSR